MVTRNFIAAVVLGASLTTSAAFAQTTLKVGSTPTGTPFTFLDTKTNTIQGIMVDLVTEVGKEAGFQVQIEPMQFSTLIAALNANKIDIISAAMFITPPRQEVVNFSGPIYTYGEGLIVPKADTKEYVSYEELKGAVVGAQVGTAFVDALKKTGLFEEVKVYDTIVDILRDVNAGRIKAGFGDFPIFAYNLQLGLFPEVRLVKSYKPKITGSVGLGVRKSDTETLSKINAALEKIKADGRLDKILAKWGLS